MSTSSKRPNLFDSEEGKQVAKELRSLMADEAYRTEPSYTANVLQYPDRQMPFIDTHLNYLNKHPEISTEHYLANLRITLKIR